ncbi:ABC-2 type transport system ATP-binding protein [Labedella gwakjiensis]|uniref:ABC-2 type transport system ATP-binding protein n=1 Tax=Labedella gwakjiensis TaxID=390269 RepID=A0A2P8H0Y9_9MICO|nr:ATP-binding cassette domain-containing protein [Labedella gwakjiensis]PSL39876.1 ABC-2 type transport system ATP-binding protein [Labedella gwakjiensis]RUQ85755.1 ATP-binding cassette domain-containing protein [Labedella gwakjiensis]
MSAEEAVAAFARADAATGDPAEETSRSEVGLPELTSPGDIAAERTTAEADDPVSAGSDEQGVPLDGAGVDDAEVDDAEVDDAEPESAEPEKAEPESAELDGAHVGGAELHGDESTSAVSNGAEPAAVAPGESDSPANDGAGDEPTRPVGFVDRLRRAFAARPPRDAEPAGAVSGEDETVGDGPALGERAPDDVVADGIAPDVSVPDVSVPDVSVPDVSACDEGDEVETVVAIDEATESASVEETQTVSAVGADDVLSVRGLTKSFGDTHAVDSLDLDVHAGSFYGIVGPNGAGKTTTLSMMTGLLRPDAGSVTVNGIDVWADPAAAKRTIGVLPDRLRVFDRLTGAQLLYYAGTLRGLKGDVVRGRVEDLARAFGLEDAMGRLVSDYSAGMVKKVSLAAAMIHSPRLLILDEPFESVDPVSAAKIVEILRVYVDNGGTVVLSSHSMDFIQRVCDHVAIIVEGQVLAAGPVEDVRGPVSLEERFLELAGGRKAAEGMEWLHSFSG